MTEMCAVIENEVQCQKPRDTRYSHGWCQMHYQRWRKHGDVHVVKSNHSILEPGTRFGRLTVVSNESNGHERVYKCRCDCGNITHVTKTNLRQRQRSCGCLQREWAREMGRANRVHGLSGPNAHPLYKKWIVMRQRCRDVNAHDYANYGGRGIYVAEPWASDPASFVTWGLENGWQPGYHTHRKDNDGPYSPENCEILSFSEHMQRHR